MKVSVKTQTGRHRPIVEVTIRDGGVEGRAESKFHSDRYGSAEAKARMIVEWAATQFAQKIIRNAVGNAREGRIEAAERWLGIEVGEREYHFAKNTQSQWYDTWAAFRRKDDGSWWFMPEAPHSYGYHKGYATYWYRVTGEFVARLEVAYHKALRAIRRVEERAAKRAAKAKQA